MQQPILSKVLSDIELRNLSEATKDVYMRTCSRYLGFLGDKPLEETGEADVRAFSQHLRCECGLEPKTVNTYLAAVLFMYEVGLDRPMNRRQIPFMRKPKAMLYMSTEICASQMKTATAPVPGLLCWCCRRAGVRRNDG